MSQNWKRYDGEISVECTSVDQFPQNAVGFIYKIVNIETGKFYIGRKSLYSNIKKNLTKTELAEMLGPGRKPKSKIVTKESNWQDYWGSNKMLLDDIKKDGVENYRRGILKICYSKKQMTYWEIHYQCTNEVLTSDKSYNDNILGKFYRRDLE